MKITNKKVFLILLIDSLFVFFAILSFYSVSEKAKLPIEIKNNSKTGALEIQENSAESYKYLESYRLLSINGVVLKDYEEIEFLCDRDSIGSLVTLNLEKGGNSIQVQVKLIEFYDRFYMFILILVFLIYMLPAVYVVVLKKGDSLSILFNFVMSSAGFFVALTWGRLYFNPYLDIPLRIMFDSAQVMLAAFLIHFSFVFPEVKFRKYKTYLWIPYLAALITIIILSYFTINYLLKDTVNAFRIYNNFHVNLLEPFFLISAVVAIFIVFHTYFTNKDEIQKKKLKWIIYGGVLGLLGYIVPWQIPKHFYVGTIPEWLMLVLTAITPISFFIAVVRYRILDVDVVIGRSTVYVIFLILYIAVVLVFREINNSYHITADLPKSLLYLLPFIGIILTAFLFDKMEMRIQNFIDKNFLKVRKNFRLSQQQFLEKLNKCLAVEEAADLLLDSIQRTIPLEQIAFALVDNKTGKSEISKSDSFLLWKDDLEYVRELDSSLLMHHILSKNHSLESGLDFDNLGTDFYSKMKSMLILIADYKEYNISSYLFLGQKKSHFQFTQEDVEILRIELLNTSLTIHKIRLQNELAIQMEESKKLAELNRLKSYFISSVSHELKTPLTSIRMFAELMKMKEQSREKSIKYYELIESECDRLNRLINNVLDYSKMESGLKQYHFSRTDVRELVPKIRDLFETQVKYNNLNLTYDIPASLSNILIDEDAFLEAAINLISNAIKYSPEKSEIVFKIEEDEKFVSLSVNDRGMGISDEDKNRILEPFFRSNNEKQLHSGGTGLGLAIIKNIMDAHKGKIDIYSKPGEGSTFILNFPKD